MATVIPATSNVEAAYEDMFKEITRKLYGEETGNGLHTLGTPVAQVATSGLTAVPEGEQRSFTNLQIDRSVQPTIEYEHNAGNGGSLTATTVAAAAASAVTVVQNAANVIIQQQQQQQSAPEGSVVVTTTGAGGNFKSEDHLNTAFGLAALMQQNGFTTTTTGNILSTQAQVINKVITTAANVSGVGGQQTVTGGDQQQQQWHNEGAQDQQQQQQQTHQQQAQIQGTTQIVQWTTTPSGKLQSYTTTTQPQTQTQNQPQLHTTPQQQQQSPQTQLNAVTASTSTTTHKTKSKNRQDINMPPPNTDTMYTNPSTSAIQNTSPSATLVATVNATASGTDNPSSTLRKKSNHQQQQQQQQQNSGSVQKRYVCTHCPYSTDRRDLYTRHENIHKDEKPFQCYVCMKQFNRADHVKKHFLRMHRDVQYDINKTRRHPPATGHQYRAGNNGGVGGGSGGGINAGVIDKGNVTIVTVNSNNANNNNSNDVKNLITLITNNLQTGDNVNLEQAFIESQRQPTSSSLSIAETIEAVASAADEPLPQLKQEKQDDDGGGGGLSLSGGNSSGGGGCLNATVKPKREKRFTCLYCPWSGADKWGLKRHLNTHTKPFVCLLCDYKAARSERLSTHILKVHNKRACSKCNFLGDSLEEYQNHLKEAHPHFVPSQRQNVSTNINVLRTISNTLGNNNNNNNNNQLNQFQNNNNFSLNNNASNINNNGNSVTIYTTNDNQNGSTSGPLQEIIVNPATMGGWRLSTTGALIPPQDLLTNGLPNAAVQKRGSERLFQYLEADGSDTEDYSRLIKMDAISRNTASVAQDFRKAGGVQELNLPANNQQFLFNNKLPPTSTTTTTSPSNQWTTKEAAALLHSLSTNAHNLKLAYQQHMQSPQQQQQHSTPTTAANSYSYTNKKRKRQHSTGDDENTPSPTSSSNSSDSISPVLVHMGEQRKAMSAYLGKNFNLQETLLYSGCGPPSVAAVNELIAQVAATNRINGEISISSITHDLKHKQQQQQHSIQDQENQEQLIRTSPAYKNKSNNNKQQQQQHTKIKSSSTLTSLYNHQQQQQQTQMRNSTNLSHCLDLQHNKENNQDATALLAQLDFQNLNKIGAQFQNYIKDIINKYYVSESTPQMLANMAIPINTTATAEWPHGSPSHERQRPHNHQLPQTPPKRKRMLSETEEYIEYLKNKEDITLTITPKVSNGNKSSAAPATPITLATKMNHGSPVKRERDLASDSYKRQSPKKSHINQSNGVSHYSTNGHNKHNNNKKNLNQLATLLPLLAEAASKQQYLTAPLDFSKKPNNNSHPTNNVMHTVTHNRPSMYDKRTSRKQAQPKKIKMAPEVIIGLLRDKYLNRMVRRKLSCWKCLQKKRYSMLVFNYHTKATLTLHTYWKHPRQSLKISKWKLKKSQTSALRINKIRAVGKRANSENVKQ